MKKTSKKTKKYRLGRFWTRDAYCGWESCSCGQAANNANQRKVESFEHLRQKNVASGLTKREHCLILGYFKFFGLEGMIERAGA